MLSKQGECACHSVEWLPYIVLPGDEEGIVWGERKSGSGSIESWASKESVLESIIWNLYVVHDCEWQETTSWYSDSVVSTNSFDLKLENLSAVTSSSTFPDLLAWWQWLTDLQVRQITPDNRPLQPVCLSKCLWNRANRFLHLLPPPPLPLTITCFVTYDQYFWSCEFLDQSWDYCLIEMINSSNVNSCDTKYASWKIVNCWPTLEIVRFQINLYKRRFCGDE